MTIHFVYGIVYPSDDHYTLEFICTMPAYLLFTT